MRLVLNKSKPVMLSFELSTKERTFCPSVGLVLGAWGVVVGWSSERLSLLPLVETDDTNYVRIASIALLGFCFGMGKSSLC